MLEEYVHSVSRPFIVNGTELGHLCLFCFIISLLVPTLMIVWKEHDYFYVELSLFSVSVNLIITGHK